MPTVYDVAVDSLINELSKRLKEEFKEIKAPAWAPYVKTSVTKERAPEDPDWWFKRCASLLRKVYINGPVGVSRLRTAYGGRQHRGKSPERFAKGSGAIIRNALKQLEAAGLIEKNSVGRKVTDKGRSLIDKIAGEILKKTSKPSKKTPSKE